MPRALARIQPRTATPEEIAEDIRRTRQARDRINHFTTIGSVRGSCGHKHRTLSGAIACLERDQAGCASQGGYSDRMIKDSDGNHIPTTTDDDGRLIVDEGEV